MAEKNQDLQSNPVTKNNHRSLGLSVLLIFSMVYNGLLFLMMIAGIVASEIFQDVLQQYFRRLVIPKQTALLFSVLGIFIFGVSIYGLILLWKFRKRGFYFYGPAQAVMLILMLLFLRPFDFVNASVTVFIIALIGLYSRSMR